MTNKAYVDKIINYDKLELTISLGFGIYIKRRVGLYDVNTSIPRTRNKTKKQARLKAFVIQAIGGKDIEIKTEGKAKNGHELVSVLYSPHASFAYPKGVLINLNEEIQKL